MIKSLRLRFCSVCASVQLMAIELAAKCQAKRQGRTHESVDDTVEREGNAYSMQHNMVEVCEWRMWVQKLELRQCRSDTGSGQAGSSLDNVRQQQE